MRFIKKPLSSFLAAAAALVAGFSLLLVDHLGPEPAVSCALEGQPTSGFKIVKDGKNCPLSYDDYLKIWDWENRSAIGLHRIGLALMAIALILFIVTVVRVALEHRRRKRKHVATQQGSTQTAPRI